jgi:hypothetical protein
MLRLNGCAQAEEDWTRFRYVALVCPCSGLIRAVSYPKSTGASKIRGIAGPQPFKKDPWTSQRGAGNIHGWGQGKRRSGLLHLPRASSFQSYSLASILGWDQTHDTPPNGGHLRSKPLHLLLTAARDPRTSRSQAV